jgi:hypothetical protein
VENAWENGMKGNDVGKRHRGARWLQDDFIPCAGSPVVSEAVASIPRPEGVCSLAHARSHHVVQCEGQQRGSDEMR